jgi:hypothetical protein
MCAQLVTGIASGRRSGVFLGDFFSKDSCRQRLPRPCYFWSNGDHLQFRSVMEAFVLPPILEALLRLLGDTLHHPHPQVASSPVVQMMVVSGGLELDCFPHCLFTVLFAYVQD